MLFPPVCLSVGSLEVNALKLKKKRNRTIMYTHSFLLSCVLCFCYNICVIVNELCVCLFIQTLNKYQSKSNMGNSVNTDYVYLISTIFCDSFRLQLCMLVPVRSALTCLHDSTLVNNIARLSSMVLSA